MLGFLRQPNLRGLVRASDPMPVTALMALDLPALERPANATS